jgi:AhpD family alkylhydroperoxidase
MARVHIHDLDSAPEASRAALERQSARIGRTINIFGAMAGSPALMNAYDGLERTIAEHTRLTSAERSAIHLTVANVNACEYCQAAYTGSAKRNGFSVEQTLAIRRGHVADDERLTALLTFARTLSQRRGWMDDEVWEATLAAGWDADVLLDAYADVVRVTLTNWFNHLACTPLDLPEAPPLDGPNG